MHAGCACVSSGGPARAEVPGAAAAQDAEPAAAAHGGAAGRAAVRRAALCAAAAGAAAVRRAAGRLWRLPRAAASIPAAVRGAPAGPAGRLRRRALWSAPGRAPAAGAPGRLRRRPPALLLARRPAHSPARPPGRPSRRARPWPLQALPPQDAVPGVGGDRPSTPFWALAHPGCRRPACTVQPAPRALQPGCLCNTPGDARIPPVRRGAPLWDSGRRGRGSSLGSEAGRSGHSLWPALLRVQGCTARGVLLFAALLFVRVSLGSRLPPPQPRYPRPPAYSVLWPVQRRRPTTRCSSSAFCPRPPGSSAPQRFRHCCHRECMPRHCSGRHWGCCTAAGSSGAGALALRPAPCSAGRLVLWQAGAGVLARRQERASPARLSAWGRMGAGVPGAGSLRACKGLADEGKREGG